MGPPSSGGIAVAQILGILEKYDLKSLGYSNPETWQIIGDATRLAFADRGLYVADSDYVFVPTEALIDKKYLATRADKIKPGERTLDVKPGDPLQNQTLNYSKNNSIELPSTTHISIVDQYGNALSMTSSIENAFGSRLMTQGGFLLNNQLTDFSFKDEVDGKLIANRVQPGKRPRSSMSPTIILKNGNPILVTGSPGGSNIISFVTNSIIAFLEWDLDIQQSVSLPHAINKWGKYEIEESLSATNLKHSLELMGYETKYRKYFSGLNAIYIGEMLEGGTDPRREGIVLGN
jgi:gamma-glutamyltranspeptidase/glutathione hydrolase